MSARRRRSEGPPLHRERAPREGLRLVASAGLAAAGALLASYLAAAQIGLVAGVWDPIFGGGSSQAVLHSWFSRALPIPDAALGAGGYLVELGLALGLFMRAGRGQAAPWLALGYGAVVAAMAVAGAALIAIQAVLLRAFCSLCLLSAAISWIIAALAYPTVAAGAHAVVANIHRRRTT
jgi:uncharacterized membrane protein